jgi:hypothetical protein
MSELTELELRTLAPEVEWPPTPDVAGRLAFARRPRRRALTAAVAIAAAALAATFAVPQSRSAVLRFFHLGGVTVVRVDTLPRAEERPLSAGLGDPVGDAEAALVLGAPFRPASHGQLYRLGGFVSTLIATPKPALLSEFGSPDLIKKFSVTSRVLPLEVAPGVPGLWIAGGPHVVFFDGSSPRLAGNVLVWTAGGVTFRLEGRGLTQADALRLAREILGTGGG